MKVVHVFYQSLPDAKGASIRGRDIVESQLALGMLPSVITCPFQRPAVPGALREWLGGVEYARTYNGSASEAIGEVTRSPFRRLSKLLSLASFAIKVRRHARERDAQLIHAHSMFYCGLAGWFAARRLGVPFVYEVRSLWEDRPHIGRGPLGAMQVRLAKKIENLTASLADAVVVISDGLKSELVGRGIPEGKITVVPNGVVLREAHAERQRTHDRASTFGYVGNLSEIESLDLLITAARELASEGVRVRVLLVGDGPERQALEQLAADAPEGLIEFRGQIAPEAVPAAYECIDVSVLARRRTTLSDAVTPLKPLEAAAFGVPILSSDLAAMRELMGDAGCAYFEAGDLASLKAMMKSMAEGQIDLNALTDNAFEMVKTKRSWRTNAAKYGALYESLRRKPA